MLSKEVPQSNLHLIYHCILAKTFWCLFTLKGRFFFLAYCSFAAWCHFFPPLITHLLAFTPTLLVYFVSSASIVSWPVYLCLPHKVMSFSSAVQKGVIQRATYLSDYFIWITASNRACALLHRSAMSVSADPYDPLVSCGL